MGNSRQTAVRNSTKKGTPNAETEATAIKRAEEELRLHAIGGRIERPNRLKSFHDNIYESLKTLAEGIVSSVGDELGGPSAKPRVNGIEEQFIDHWGYPPEVDTIIKEQMLRPEHIVQTSMLDRKFDNAMADAFSKFDKSSTKASGEIQTSYDDWKHAMRLYESVSRSASDVFVAKVDALKESSLELSKEHYNDEEQVLYFETGEKIADALNEYEADMTKATTTLSAALADLIKARFGSWADVAIAEVALIQARQSVTQQFWSGTSKELSTR
jgi:hypothetical protein